MDLPNTAITLVIIWQTGKVLVAYVSKPTRRNDDYENVREMREYR